MSFRGVVDILGIVLPLVILLLGMIRLFSENRRGHNSITMISAILLLLVGLIRFLFFPGGSRSDDASTKLKAIRVSKHSEKFNQSLESVLSAYYKLTDAFTNNDASSVNEQAGILNNSLNNFTLDELKKDTLIYETAVQPFESTRAEVTTLISATTPDAKKIAYKNLSENLFNLVSIVHYDVIKLYWLECDKAFGENNAGNWISKTEQSANPYGQKDCAEVKTNINFVPVDSTAGKSN